MKSITILTAYLIISISSFGQTNQQSKEDVNSITSFEKYIISGREPINTNVQTKYEDEFRVIVWDEPLIKSYKYSNEAFDKLGYELAGENEGDYQQSSRVYRNCEKGIFIEVTEWYKMKFSISMNWFEPNRRSRTAYLMYCETYMGDDLKQNRAEIEYQLNKSAEEKREKIEKETESYAQTHVFDLNASNPFDVKYTRSHNNIQTIIEEQIKNIIMTKGKDIENITFSGYIEVQINKNGNIKGVLILPDDSKNNFISDLNLEKFDVHYSNLFYKGFPINNATDKIKIDFSYKVRKEQFKFKDGTLYLAEDNGGKVIFNKEKLEKIATSIEKKKGLYNVTFIESEYNIHDSFIEILDVKKKSKIVKILGNTALALAIIAIVAVLYL